MSVNASALSAINPIVVYSILGVYGIFMAAVVLYIYQKFSNANRLLVALQRDWEGSQAAHLELLAETRDRISKLAPVTAVQKPQESRPRSVSFDTRNQIMSMGRKGLAASDIARACNMSEAEVEVLLSLARIQ